MSQNNVYPSGYLVFVEGDKEEWFQAFEWQKNEFIKAMKFGTMKTMCYPNPITKSKPFKYLGNLPPYITVEFLSISFMISEISLLTQFLLLVLTPPSRKNGHPCGTDAITWNFDLSRF